MMRVHWLAGMSLWVKSGHCALSLDVRFTPNSGHQTDIRDVRYVPIADIREAAIKRANTVFMARRSNGLKGAELIGIADKS